MHTKKGVKIACPLWTVLFLGFSFGVVIVDSFLPDSLSLCNNPNGLHISQNHISRSISARQMGVGICYLSAVVLIHAAETRGGTNIVLLDTTRSPLDMGGYLD